MLSVITSERRWRSHLVYDLEWIPDTYELRMVGVYDGQRYRRYSTIEAFLRAECTHKTRGRWFYAHAGGLADMNFLMAQFQRAGGWDVRCAFSGSSAIIVQVARNKHSWTFCDSLWLLKAPLASIGDWLGTKKGGQFVDLDAMDEAERKSWYATVDEYTLGEYNRIDCEILWEAIYRMQHVLWQLGGQLQKTLASSAMQLFRRKFLTRDIPTNGWVNARAEHAYIASRVEVFAERAEDAFYLDINSSFPHSMTEPQPAEFKEWRVSIPPGDGVIYLARASITVPEMELPPLATRMKGRIFFPVGTWTGWFSSVDLELLQEFGGAINKVYEVLTFEPFSDLAGYVETIYQMRKDAETVFEKVAFKFLLNMLYGKFAEGQEKDAIHLDPKTIGDDWSMIVPGLWRYSRRIPIPHRHVPIAMHTTALSRANLYRYMASCSKVHYCDTDGFSSETSLPTSDEIGGLKLEKLIIKGRFVAPKIYHLSAQELQKDGSWQDVEYVKAKGFSDMTVEKFGDLLEGNVIYHERMLRIKEQSRTGRFKAGSRTVPKKLQRAVLSKRYHYPDGETRPWHYGELAKFFNVSK